MGHAPLRELSHDSGVCVPSVAVTDARGKEFDEFAPGLFTGVTEKHRDSAWVLDDRSEAHRAGIEISHKTW